MAWVKVDEDRLIRLLAFKEQLNVLVKLTPLPLLLDNRCLTLLVLLTLSVYIKSNPKRLLLCLSLLLELRLCIQVGQELICVGSIQLSHGPRELEEVVSIVKLAGQLV